jgi:hypothetical protein
MLQASLANQQTGLQAQQLNQAAGLQAALANAQYSMQAQTLGYQGGLGAAMQTQQLGLQGAEAGGQLGLQAAYQQALAQQQQQALNMQAISGTAGLEQQASQLNLQGYGAGLTGLGALSQAAQSEQRYQQQLADAAYQQWMNQFTLPAQGTAFALQMLGLQPLPYTTTSTGATTGTQTVPGPGIASLFGGLLGGAGTLMKGLGFREGGFVDAAEDRPMRIGKKRGGLATVTAMKRRPAGLGQLSMAA